MYITAEQLRQYTERNMEESDTLAELICSAACDVVNDYLGYDPEEKTETRIYDGNGTNQLSIGVRPVTAIDRILVSGVIVPISEVCTREQYLYRVTGIFPAGSANIAVTFTAGYSEVPGIIRMTALRIAGVLASEGGGNIGIQSKSFSDAGSRVFLNSRFDRYLEAVEKYRIYEV